MRHLAVAMALFTIVGLVAAQDQMPMPPRAAERLEQYKKLRMMEVLKLDEETSLRFFARYNKHREELAELNKKRDEILDELARLRRENAADKDFQKVIDELKGMADPALGAREKFFNDIEKILTPK